MKMNLTSKQTKTLIEIMREIAIIGFDDDNTDESNERAVLSAVELAKELNITTMLVVCKSLSQHYREKRKEEDINLEHNRRFDEEWRRDNPEEFAEHQAEMSRLFPVEREEFDGGLGI